MPDLTGTLTLNPFDLPNACTQVYLLDDAEIPADGAVLYEASLDGGTTWEAVTAGETTTLGHTGTSLVIRATLTIADDSENAGNVYWLIGFAS